jgi:hypothetical protein
LGTVEMDQIVLVEAIGDEGEEFDVDLMITMELGCEKEGSNVDLMNTMESSEGEGSDADLIHEHNVQSQLHVIISRKVEKIIIFP